MSTMSRRSALAMGAAAAALPLTSCGSGSGEAADAAFSALGQRWLAGFAQQRPVYATQIGDHRFDAELDSYGSAARAAQAAFRTEIGTALSGIERAKLSRDNQVDAAMLENALAIGDFDADGEQSWAWNPLDHVGLAGQSLYGLMARDFAPAPERLKSAIARMNKLDAFLAEARDSMTPERTPQIHAETASKQNAGIASIIDGLVLSQADALGAEDRLQLTAAADRAKAALAAHQKWIDETLLPNAKGDFRLGAELYDRKLTLALFSPMSRQTIRSEADAALARVRAEMEEIARQVLGKNAPADPQAAIAAALAKASAEIPARDKVMEEAERTLAEATAFARKADIITLPDAPVKIIVMPEFQQGVAVAYCDSPGPLDKHLDTFYAVSPIPAAWTNEQAKSFLKEYNLRSMHELTVHEAMPGHYVQLWHSNKHPSVTRAVLGSGPFIEGWACYAQDVMGEAGYFGDDPLRRLVNLKWALRVISNAILDQQVHVDGVSREDAMTLMTQGAFQEEREAAGKWTRARLSSAQLPTYFVGWTEHHQLRRDAEAKWAETFSLKRYHDAVLSHGSPPVRFARAMLFDEPII